MPPKPLEPAKEMVDPDKLRAMIAESDKPRRAFIEEEKAKLAAEPKSYTPVGTFIGVPFMREQMKKEGYTFTTGERCNGKPGAPPDVIDGFIASLPTDSAGSA